MHMCHEDKARWAKSGVILSYMNMDDVAPWVGTHVGRRGDDYEAFKTRHAERLLDEVETHFPGLRAAIDSIAIIHLPLLPISTIRVQREVRCMALQRTLLWER